MKVEITRSNVGSRLCFVWLVVGDTSLDL
jgi:hypothetical protein